MVLTRTVPTETEDAQAIQGVLGPPSPMPATIASMLAQSRTAHQAYVNLTLAPQIHRPPPPLPPGDAATARAQLTSAAQLRSYAQTQDQTHQDASWGQEVGTIFENPTLLRFYRSTFGA